MKRIEITIPGVPVAQPRQRTRIRGKGKTMFAQNYTPATHPVQDFKLAIRRAIQEAGITEVWRGPVRVEWVAVFPRPSGKVWKTKPMPRYRHTSKPDRDNVDKAILDAMKGFILADDSQVCDGRMEKFVASGAEQPHVSIVIEEMEQ
jgi:Holliday junction resolvase RusA-like endonuclease